MSGKKHPILIVFVVLGITILFLGLVMTLALTFTGPSSGISFADKIGVIPIEGPITDSRPVVSQLIDFRKNRRIKAIILRVDSPGGGVGPSQEIYREVRRTVKSKTVIASMGGVAASGGYYIASGTNKIVANPGTITGSIGVIMEFIRLEDLLKKIGISMEVLKSGEFKDVGSPHRKMSERERTMITDLISDVQSQFVEAVADGRGMSIDKVREIADGRILSGAQAKALGLVDSLGNFHDAVQLAKKMSGIKGEAAMVYPKKKRVRFWDLFFQEAYKAFSRNVKDSRNTAIEYRWDGL